MCLKMNPKKFDYILRPCLIMFIKNCSHKMFILFLTAFWLKNFGNNLGKITSNLTIEFSWTFPCNRIMSTIDNLRAHYSLCSFTKTKQNKPNQFPVQTAVCYLTGCAVCSYLTAKIQRKNDVVKTMLVRCGPFYHKFPGII